MKNLRIEFWIYWVQIWETGYRMSRPILWMGQDPIIRGDSPLSWLFSLSLPSRLWLFPSGNHLVRRSFGCNSSLVVACNQIILHLPKWEFTRTYLPVSESKYILDSCSNGIFIKFEKISTRLARRYPDYCIVRRDNLEKYSFRIFSNSAWSLNFIVLDMLAILQLQL